MMKLLNFYYQTTNLILMQYTFLMINIYKIKNNKFNYILNQIFWWNSKSNISMKLKSNISIKFRNNYINCIQNQIFQWNLCLIKKNSITFSSWEKKMLKLLNFYYQTIKLISTQYTFLMTNIHKIKINKFNKILKQIFQLHLKANISIKFKIIYFNQIQD